MIQAQRKIYKINVNQKVFVANQFSFSLAMIANQSISSPAVAVSAFRICRGLCVCTEMLWMCEFWV